MLYVFEHVIAHDPKPNEAPQWVRVYSEDLLQAAARRQTRGAWADINHQLGHRLATKLAGRGHTVIWL